MMEAQRNAKEWQSEHPQYLESFSWSPESGATLPANTALALIRDFSGLCTGLFIGLSLHAPFFSGSRRLYGILVDPQNGLTMEL